MLKNVKTLLVEFHLMLIKKRIEQLQHVEGPGVIIDEFQKKIEDINKNGIKFPGEMRGWAKPYYSTEVISTPKLIKDGDTIIGIALQIGWLSVKDANKIPDYIIYINDYTYNKYVLQHTVSPCYHVYQTGSYPKKLIHKNYQLAVSPTISNIDGTIPYKLVYEKWDKVVSSIKGTIRTTPENYWVATINEDDKIIFDSFEDMIKDIDFSVVEDMWNRGIIEKI